MIASLLRCLVLGAVACATGVSAGSLRLRSHFMLAALNDTAGNGSSPSDDWHKDLGKGLKPEHNVDTVEGQTNATHTYDSVAERTQEDLSYEAHKKAKKEKKAGNESGNSTNATMM